MHVGAQGKPGSARQRHPLPSQSGSGLVTAEAGGPRGLQERPGSLLPPHTGRAGLKSCQSSHCLIARPHGINPRRCQIHSSIHSPGGNVLCSHRSSCEQQNVKIGFFKNCLSVLLRGERNVFRGRIRLSTL